MTYATKEGIWYLAFTVGCRRENMRREYSTAYTVYHNVRTRSFDGAEVERMRSLIFDHGERLGITIDEEAGYYAMYAASGARDRVNPTKQEAEYAERVLDLISE